MTAAGFFHCSVKSVGRANGRSVVAAAAYRSGERLEDARSGEVFDFRARGGVVDSFILAPDASPDWVQDRSQLWSNAELSEGRANGRLATELELALPHELAPETREQLLMDFLAPIIERHHTAADVAIHEPGKEGDHRNSHAHVLFTHRTLDEDGFIEKQKGQRKDLGLSSFAMGGEAVSEIRKEWEHYVNQAYERAGLDIRVDHRSHEERGIGQEPTKHLGPVASAIERRGEASDRGDENRAIAERNREREQLAHYEQLAAVTHSQIILLRGPEAAKEGHQRPEGGGEDRTSGSPAATPEQARQGAPEADRRGFTFGQLVSGIGRILGEVIDAVSEFFVKPAREERAEKDATQDWLIAEQQRTQRAEAERDPSLTVHLDAEAARRHQQEAEARKETERLIQQYGRYGVIRPAEPQPGRTREDRDDGHEREH